MSLEILAMFAVTELFLSLSPGPAVLLVVSQGMKYGYASSARGAAGILTGNAIYFALSALGLGAILLASKNLFVAIKWIGIAYLIYVGIKMLFTRGAFEQTAQPQIAPKPGMRLFMQGLITQLSNPKAIIFFAALLPQFVSAQGNVFEQFMLLGVVSIAVECPVLLAYGWLAERGQQLLPKRKLAGLPDRIAGVCLIGVGIGLAAMKRP
jgi:threonine/homoserine/homoserine lactone efflux protein